MLIYMSEFQTDSIDRRQANILNEEFFDEHSEWGADIIRYRLNENIVIFADPYYMSKTFLIEFRFHLTKTMVSNQYKEIKIMESGLSKLLKYTEVDVYRDRNKLFFRKLRL